jgi:hypothetical protein
LPIYNRPGLVKLSASTESTVDEQNENEMNTEKGNKLTVRKIETSWHPFGGRAKVTAFVNGHKITNSQTGTSQSQAVINAKLGALNFANSLGL